MITAGSDRNHATERPAPHSGGSSMTIPSRIRAAIGSAVIIALFAIYLIMAAPDPSAHAAASPGPRITRAEILNRAATWMRARPAYSQGHYYDAATGRYTSSLAGNPRAYRSDCSGFVSMAWATNSRTLWTMTLPQVSHPILKRDLRPGDALLQRGHHVVLFVKWDDSAHSTATLWHQSNLKDDMKESHYRVNGSYLGGFTAIRYNQVFEQPGTVLAPPKPRPVPKPSTQPASGNGVTSFEGYRVLSGSPQSGNDQCGWWIVSQARNLRYRSCVHHSVNGWYGGLQIQNLTPTPLRPQLFWWDWTARPDGADRTRQAPGGGGAAPALPARATIYIIGTTTHTPTDRCTAIQGRPTGTGHTEIWASTPFSRANTTHCTLPPQWSSPR